jgi:hypothetical protein
MLHKCNCSLVILALSVGVVDVARAGVVYNESVSGDLSGNGLTPTLVSLALGSNQVFGSTGRNADGVVDRDYFTFTVPGGLQWSALLVLPGTTTIGQLGFIGLELGNQLTLPTTTTTAAGLLGWRHYNTADINTDILPEVGVPANGSSGFTPPLSSGSYTLWVQETGTGSSNYGFDIVVTSVPEPQTYITMLLALAVLAVYRCRKLAAF